MSEVRLQRYLSQCGVAARRKAEQLIVEGRVRVNRMIVTQLGTKVDPQTDRVTVDGNAVYPQDLIYILLNKPKGCVTAVSDPEGRPTVMHFLPGVPVKVAPVGRLDFYSEGVLLLTNDGELASRLLSASYGVAKTYHVKVRGSVRPAHLEALRRGVTLDDGTLTAPADVDTLPTASKHEWLVVTITEGKNRQVRRMLEALGYQVTKLQRVAFAGINFHGLRVGDARELSQVEVNELRRMVKLPANTVSRGTWTAKRETTDIARRARARQRELAAAAAPSQGAPDDRPQRSAAPTGGDAARSGRRPGAKPTRKPGAKPTRSAGTDRPRRPGAKPTRSDGTDRPRRTGAKPTRSDGTDRPRRTGAKPTRSDGTDRPRRPGAKPTRKPGAKPTRSAGTDRPRKPGAKPTRKPGAKPTRSAGTDRPRKPGAKPTRKPGAKPTRKPGAKPTRKPGAKPTRSTSTKPASKPGTTRRKPAGGGARKPRKPRNSRR